MRYTEAELLAGTMTSTSRFERVLPPEARTQLAHRKRFQPLKVKLPPPRAALVRLPEWQPGTSRLLYMPYRLEVVGLLKGTLASESLLPQSGNLIGDTWAVNGVPWIWLTVPGTSSPTWVDP
jgi:hypothetical protein